MEDDPSLHPEHAYQQMRAQMDEQHQYPHSHHGTPATEYTGFLWPSPHDLGDSAIFGVSPQRPNHQSLHPLVMPQWPSMLGSQTSQVAPPYYSSPQAQGSTASPTPLMTPVSASSARSTSTPRKTLTDDQRRQMCEYHESNPKAKQNQIGGKS